MKQLVGTVCAFAFLAQLVGCDPPKVKEYDGPIIDKFVGSVVHDGKPVKFTDDEIVSVQLLASTPRRLWTIPVKSDGTFEITWMPIGKFFAILERKDKSNPMSRNKFSISDDFRIEDGKTEYVIELGPNWKQ